MKEKLTKNAPLKLISLLCAFLVWLAVVNVANPIQTKSIEVPVNITNEEVLESSNLTYRLYDYDRIDKDGKKRELHIDKVLDVANLCSSAEPKQPLRVLKYRQGVASELLTRCKYFEVYRMIVNTERRQTVHYRADELAFRVLLCVNGCGTISHENGTIPFYKGDCIFVPADSVTLTIQGQAQFLDVRG